jgi:hypothetical protein
MDNTVKKTVQLELEVDTVSKGPNKYQGVIDLARAVDVGEYFHEYSSQHTSYLLYKSTIWFMALSEPNNAQAGLISVIVGAGAAWFGLYCGSGPKMSKPEDKK